MGVMHLQARISEDPCDQLEEARKENSHRGFGVRTLAINQKRQGRRAPIEASESTTLPAPNWTSDVQPPELQGNIFLLF